MPSTEGAPSVDRLELTVSSWPPATSARASDTLLPAARETSVWGAATLAARIDDAEHAVGDPRGGVVGDDLAARVA
ncbi:MAG: hypothetical protein EBU54_15365 [Mycobacteriaceae bacterium]|nr:hypothetical protein [Mycobacteriaceae bacterium]